MESSVARIASMHVLVDVSCHDMASAAT